MQWARVLPVTNIIEEIRAEGQVAKEQHTFGEINLFFSQ